MYMWPAHIFQLRTSPRSFCIFHHRAIHVYLYKGLRLCDILDVKFFIIYLCICTQTDALYLFLTHKKRLEIVEDTGSNSLSLPCKASVVPFEAFATRKHNQIISSCSSIQGHTHYFLIAQCMKLKLVSGT